MVETEYDPQGAVGRGNGETKTDRDVTAEGEEGIERLGQGGEGGNEGRSAKPGVGGGHQSVPVDTS